MNSGLSQVNRAHRLFLAVASALLVTSCGAAEVTDAQPPQAPPATAPAEAEVEAAPKPPQVGDTAPDFELASISGAKVKLSDVSEQGPVVLVMLRGFPGYQCPMCTAQFGQLRNKAKEFAAAKAHVLLVYPGPTAGLKAHAEEFVKGKDKAMAENFDLLLDPDYAFTKLYGLRWDAKGETSYPSTFVLDSKRTVLFAKVSHSHGDRTKADDVLAALPE